MVMETSTFIFVGLLSPFFIEKVEHVPKEEHNKTYCQHFMFFAFFTKRSSLLIQSTLTIHVT